MNGANDSRNFKKPVQGAPSDDKRAPVTRKWRIVELFPELKGDVDEKLRAYFLELVRFNGRINLISARTEEHGDLIHIADSIYAAKMILKKSTHKQIYDIGSGNGLPGIIIALLDPSRQVILIDKDARKIEFLKHVAARIGMKNITAMQKRIEELPEDSVHCCVSRGFASISKSILTLRKCCSKGAEYYHMKSESWVREIAQIPTQVISFWEPELIGEYKLPMIESQFAVVLTRKI